MTGKTSEAASRIKTVAVIGASRNRAKYGNKSVRAHLAQGWKVFPVHPSAAEIEGQPAYPTVAAVPVDRLDRVTMYVPPDVGLGLLEDIAMKQPAELWLNPGSESSALVARAVALGLPVIQACSIVDLGLSPAHFAD